MHIYRLNWARSINNSILSVRVPTLDVRFGCLKTISALNVFILQILGGPPFNMQGGGGVEFFPRVNYLFKPGSAAR